MGVKFFGQFLLEKNIIKPEELIEAVEYQESRNLKFGEYALSKGYLTEKDSERIQNEQKHTDMQFGEIAVKLGILNSTQVKEILTIQKNDHIFIGEALFEKAFLTSDVLERELSLFKEDQGKYIAGEIIIPAGAENPEIVRDMADMTQKMLQRIAYINVKVDHGFISNEEPQRNFLLVSVCLSGSLKYEYVISSSLETSRLIASKIIGEEIKEELREVIADGVKEFCNIICGNIVAKIAKRGKTVDITPPEEVVYSVDGYHLIKGRRAIYYPLVSPEGDITLILVEG